MNPHNLLFLLASPLFLAACTSTPILPGPEVLENSLGMTFVRLPAGEFLMGSDETPQALARDYPQNEAWRFAELSDEAPVHRVRISRPFFLGQHEVTVGQFRRFVEASGHVPESVADGTGGYGYNPAYDPAASKRGDLFEGRDPKYSWRNPGFAQDDTHPVLNVTWNDAVAMSRWLSRKEGRRYRLPSEAEWEYACRAGSTSRYYSGNSPGSLLQIANTFDADAAAYWPALRAQAQPGSDGHAFTAPVGSYRPNAFGLYDMLGNAWEWTADWHDEAYYAASPAVDPPGPADGSVRVRRGGSWHTWALYSRCSYRNWNSPQTRYTLVGMRLLLEAGSADR
ncbi:MULTISPECIES: formylglycine-generating enzyme family protein [unclassified Polaromonas]|uniref:formylglycine-generating enzyme family protein n=2 Tax=Polaromonas TaxID=52972 RepID=UPI0018CB4A3B|nr:formylglycine-generating enzyme required for sulfatase activity [Polaromonas sp. CG_9.7]MBG6113316.1 formylglycine-generating enzyme required for sulfatase activity [Polaromonas sp. CG_9.2]MDH6183229.1 formylglycine-generating enzyme required for sulfatase activity [Polaromonas sp. CG_23.6]